jgi:competence protein ComEC
MRSVFNKRNLGLLVMLLALILGALALASSFRSTASGKVVWTIINVSHGDRTGDAHLLQTPNGENWLIDTGFADLAEFMLLPYLQEKNIQHLDKLIVSHPHRNHYGGIHVLLNAGITIHDLYFDAPHPTPCANEDWAMGCDLEHVLNMQEYAVQFGVEVKSLEPNLILSTNQNENFSFQVLYRFDGNDTPVGITSINDTSAIMRMDVGEVSVLFPGDIGNQIGEHLSTEGENLDTDLLSIPHHGVSVSAPNSFFDRVSPEIGFVSGLHSLWESDRAERIKNYFDIKQIPVYVSDKYRAIRVEINDDDYKVNTE